MNDTLILFEDDFLKVSFDGSTQNNRCLIAFTGVGHQLGGVDIQNEEFKAQCSLGMVIWVIDKKRSWGNNLNIVNLSKVLIEISTGKEVYLIGNSMGGFLAILMSKLLKARRTITFVPQFSIYPEVVPNEKRWISYRKNIRKIRYTDLSESFDKNCEYAVLVGSSIQDEIHNLFFRKYAKAPNIFLYQFLDVGHDITRKLKNANLLNKCINDFFSGSDLSHFFNEHGTELR